MELLRDSYKQILRVEDILSVKQDKLQTKQRQTINIAASQQHLNYEAAIVFLISGMLIGLVTAFVQSRNATDGKTPNGQGSPVIPLTDLTQQQD